MINNRNPYPKVWLGICRMWEDIIPHHHNNGLKDIATIEYAISRDIIKIDTSERYVGGKVKILTEEVIKQFHKDRCFIATKVCEHIFTHDSVINSRMNSFKILNTSYIDLYYIHRWNTFASIEEVVKVFNKFLNMNNIRLIGLGNVGIDIKIIKKWTLLLNKLIYAAQNQYNFICYKSQRKMAMKYCKRNRIKLIMWRAIMFLYSRASDLFYCMGIYKLLYEVVVKNKPNVQLAFKWLLQQYCVPIVFKSSNKKHLNGILGVENLQLSNEDLERLDKKFPVQIDKGYTARAYFELS
ncbi:MAG: aldo/keto reductase [Nitrososphaeria archaeon]